jgi:hypothetical protein
MIKKSLFAGIAIMALAGSVAAASLASEPFNYTIGSNLNGQGGWTLVSGTANQLEVSTGSLSFAGLPASTANSAWVTELESEDLALDFAAQTDSGSGYVVYASALVNFSALPSTTASGQYFFHLTQTGSTTTFFARCFARTTAGNVEFGIRGSSADGPVFVTSPTVPLGTTAFVVIKYQSVPGASNDVASIFINPTPGAVEPAAGATTTPSAEPAAGGIGRVSLRQSLSSGEGMGTLTVDEIRVGTTWADVTPAASSVSDWSIY